MKLTLKQLRQVIGEALDESPVVNDDDNEYELEEVDSALNDALVLAQDYPDITEDEVREYLLNGGYRSVVANIAARKCMMRLGRGA
jgi:hypothetical protein